jgi:hypothetical protein
MGYMEATKPPATLKLYRCLTVGDKPGAELTFAIFEKQQALGRTSLQI